MKRPTPTDRYSLAGVDRAVAVLDVFDAAGSLALVDIARAAQLSEATALRYVSSLTAHGLLEREDDTGRYRLGLELFRLGQRALRVNDPRKAALPAMEALLERFEETVNLALRHREELILIEALESTRSIRKGAAVGDRDLWHASALGKALLAALPPDEARALLRRHPRPKLTERTLTKIDDLLADFEVVRRRGFAVDDEESELGARCVGAAVRDHRGTPCYALSVAGPASRIGAERIAEFGEAVTATAAAISARLGYDGEG